uniref:Uncharacterized protein n=1 Tax=Medicago truncatula TaxID=3880 RepID=I3T6J3_MEDTR|nr:unknown [Medicago truncatula]
MSETLVVRISGHMPTKRRNSIVEKSIPVMYFTVDFISSSDAVTSFG